MNVKTMKSTNEFRWLIVPMGEHKPHMVGAIRIGDSNRCQILQQAYICLQDGSIEWKFLNMSEWEE